MEPSFAARGVRRTLRRSIKPANDSVGADLVSAIRSGTDRRPAPTVRVRGVRRRPIGPTELGGETGERTSVRNVRRHLIHFHGGYHVGGGPALYRNLAARLAGGLDAEVFVLDLPLAPEQPFPAALECAWSAYEALICRGDVDSATAALTGDSAGGGLALAVAQRAAARRHPMPGALVLISPWLDLTGTAESVDRNDDHDDMLSAGALRGAAALYAGGPLGRPEVSPLFGSLEGLPPSFVTVDESETLHDDARGFLDRATAASSRVDLCETKGLFHIWPVFVPFVREARRTVSDVVRFLDSTLD